MAERGIEVDYSTLNFTMHQSWKKLSSKEEVVFQECRVHGSTVLNGSVDGVELRRHLVERYRQPITI